MGSSYQQNFKGETVAFFENLKSKKSKKSKKITPLVDSAGIQGSFSVNEDIEKANQPLFYDNKKYVLVEDKKDGFDELKNEQISKVDLDEFINKFKENDVDKSFNALLDLNNLKEEGIVLAFYAAVNASVDGNNFKKDVDKYITSIMSKIGDTPDLKKRWENDKDKFKSTISNSMKRILSDAKFSNKTSIDVNRYINENVENKQLLQNAKPFGP